jgi:Na+-transporting NADH:ubiquinone oxidoreductase subunit NqrB
VFRVIVSPAKQRRWPRYVGAAILIAFMVKDPVAAAHLAHSIGRWVLAVASGLSAFVSGTRIG